MEVRSHLLSAVREGRLETSRQIIDNYGLSYAPSWANGYVLLVEALKRERAAVAKLLLTSGSKVNSNNSKIRPTDTPLHLAVGNGDIEIVEMILNKGATIDAINKYGETPLHIAIEHRKMEITELLLKCGAGVNNCISLGRHIGFTPLHLAVENDSKELVTLLLSRHAYVNAGAEDNVTPLHIAAKRGHTNVDVAKDLLEHGASINSLTLKGYSPLHFASERGNQEAVKLFLDKGADVNLSTEGHLTPLHIAIENGRETVVKLLLECGAAVDNQNTDKTILQLAVENGSLTIVKEILKYCPDINNASNRSSIRTAVFGRKEVYGNILRALLEYGLPIEANNPELLHAAVEKGYVQAVKDILKYNADILHNSTVEGLTPLHNAVKNRQEEVAKLLISHGAKVNAEDKSGKMPIFYAIMNADLKMCKLFLNNGANVKGYPEILNIAVEKEDTEIVEALLQLDVDINACDEYGRTALHFIASSDLDLFNASTDKDPNNKAKIVKLLLSKGANVNAQTNNGSTTLLVSCQKGYVKIVEALLEYNANVNLGPKNGITPLHSSADEGNQEISKMLLNKGADVNAKTENGDTALHIATRKGHEGVVKVLLECNAKLKYQFKATPLYSEDNPAEIIETVLKFGADVNARNGVGRTPLHEASREGREGIVAALLEYGADINITSKRNATPLDDARLGKRYFHKRLERHFDAMDYYPSDYLTNDAYDEPDPGYYSCEAIAKVLGRYVVKMGIANLYLSEQNLVSMAKSDWKNDEMAPFCGECEEEIASMKSENIDNANISFHDILAKSSSSLLAAYMRNENVVQALESNDYKTKFPIYACLIKSNFRKGMERKAILEHCNKILQFLFKKGPQLPYDCIEKILTYLSEEDLRTLSDV